MRGLVDVCIRRPVFAAMLIATPVVIGIASYVRLDIDRFPSVVLLGGAVLAWTGYTMVVREPLLGSWFADHPRTKLVAAVLIFSISLAPWYSARLSEHARPLVVLLPGVLVWILAVEVAAAAWQLQLDFLLADDTREYLLEAVRWLGWLPLAAAWLWLRERVLVRRQMAHR